MNLKVLEFKQKNKLYAKGRRFLNRFGRQEKQKEMQ